MNKFAFIPESASSISGPVDLLFYGLTALSVVLTLAVLILTILFSVRYRQRPEVAPEDRKPTPHLPMVEWTAAFALTVLFLGIFFIGAVVYMKMAVTPGDSMEVFVVGKQWMWKIQHPEGKREINELHIPIGQPIKLTMTSEDVIHDVFIPAFRLKKDVIPGRYTTLWFEATKPGRYHLFCAEYCGTQHSRMIGTVIAMEPEQYSQWASGGGGGATETLAQKGEKLFTSLGCVACHKDKSLVAGPSLEGIYGEEQVMDDGQKVVIDAAYVRESILYPKKKIVAGFDPLMPTFKGRISEDELLQLVSYVRSLTPEKTDAGTGGEK